MLPAIPAHVATLSAEGWGIYATAQLGHQRAVLVLPPDCSSQFMHYNIANAPLVSFSRQPLPPEADSVLPNHALRNLLQQLHLG